MAYDEKTADRIRRAIGPRNDVSEKKMFGGIAFLLDGKMFCGIATEDLMVRVGPERYGAALAQPHVRPMDFTGRPLTGYVYVSPEGVRTEKAIKKWVDQAAAFVATIDGSAKKRSRKETMPMSRSKEVDAWFAKYVNPMKDVVERVRSIVLAADPRIEECLKWQAPTFTYRGNLASFFPKSKQHASLMFHQGAKIPGKHPRLEGGGDTGRMLKIGSVAEANAAKRDIESLVRAWCDWRDAETGTDRASRPAKKAPVKKAPASKKAPVKKARAGRR